LLGIPTRKIAEPDASRGETASRRLLLENVPDADESMTCLNVWKAMEDWLAFGSTYSSSGWGTRRRLRKARQKIQAVTHVNEVIWRSTHTQPDGTIVVTLLATTTISHEGVLPRLGVDASSGLSIMTLNDLRLRVIVVQPSW
jgi:hypothetical protein